mmetsp:Transcript_25663/g.42206  ORF Transcript_25663/g.42206 Transcript_25663/m.42206 type:complete len:547 (-) Transcript_25663:249-1889(-)
MSTVAPSVAAEDPPVPDGVSEEEKKRIAEERKKRKEEEKKKAAEEKAAKAAKKAEQEALQAIAKISLDGPLTETFGDYELIASQKQTHRTWIRVEDLKAGPDPIWIRGRIHNSRAKGKLCFIVLRQGSSTVQVVFSQGDHTSKELIKYAAGLPKESIVDIFGLVTVAAQKIEKCSQQDVEVQGQKIYCVSSANPQLPFQIEDASRPESAFEKDPSLVTVGMDTRLNNRVMDLRTPAKHAIFRLQSAVGTLFREFLLSHNFVEIHTPKLIAGTSEGGSAVFRLKYFQWDACLAQSPQLYKQMAVCGDLERVFEVAPVFRAENSDTHRHLTEFMGLDLEMAIKEHYSEVLDVLDGLFVYIFENLEKRFGKELEAVKLQFPFEPFKFLKPSLRIKFQDGIAMLRAAGVQVGDYDDLTTAQERKLGQLVKDKYDTDFYILDKFPLAIRPFYTMPDPHNPNYSNSYDLFMRGEEIVSGAQRVHDPVLLEARARSHGIPIPPLQSYIDAFKYGAPPHGGAGIGLERVVMLYLALQNIRNSSLFPRDPGRLNP